MKLKETFDIEEEGYEETLEDESVTLTQFIEYIKVNIIYLVFLFRLCLTSTNYDGHFVFAVNHCCALRILKMDLNIL